jgi:hypothetical protein
MKTSLRKRLEKMHVRFVAPLSGAGNQKVEPKENNDMEDVSTVAGCEATLKKLSEGIAVRDKELEELIQERGTLIEDAALNLNGAPKLLKDIDEKIKLRSADREIKRQAIASVSNRLARAREVLAREHERQREFNLGVLARQVLVHAEAYSAHLQEAATAGDSLRSVVQSMQTIATPTERLHMDKLLDHGCYARAAEHAGIKRLIPMLPPYPGPRAHIVPLDQAVRLLLDRWIVLVPEEVTEPETQEPEQKELEPATEQVQ